MAIVKCPECGERVKYRSDQVKFRCPDCGRKFRAPNEEDDKWKEERPRTRYKKKSSNMLLIPAIIGGLAFLVLAMVVIVLVLGKGDSSGNRNRVNDISGKGDSIANSEKVRDRSDKGDSSANRVNADSRKGSSVHRSDSLGKSSTVQSVSPKVTVENFQKIDSAMDLAESEQILGASRLSSFEDAAAEFSKTDSDDKPAWMRKDPGLPRNPAHDWRRWDGRDFIVWVVFINTKFGKLSVYGVGLGPRYQRSFTNPGTGVEPRLEEAYAVRKKTLEVRKDTKWLRGEQAQTALLGEWRKDTGDGWLFEARGKLKPFWDFVIPPHETQPPTYRFLDDKQLEITHPSFGDMPTKQIFEYYILKDELVLMDVTPTLYGRSTRNAQFFYRMPPKPGSLAYTKLIQPLIADINNPTSKQHSWSLFLLSKFDQYALPSLRELARKAPNDKKAMYEGSIRSVEARLAREKERGNR